MAGVQAGSSVSLQRVMQKGVRGNGMGVLGGEWCGVLMVFSRATGLDWLEAHAASASLATGPAEARGNHRAALAEERCRIIVNEGGA
jgi:hypothetical protein